MSARVFKVDPAHPEPALIAQAAERLRGGGLVAFPTETVYGLGVDPFHDLAIQRLYLVKGRPAEKGLILHLSDLDQIDRIARDVPAAARKLAARFFPGPLTLVLPALPRVSGVVTGHSDTVAVRMPDHPVALALIREFGRPIAAPSANPSGAPPPTTAAEVVQSLGTMIDAIVDGGATPGGVPSTLVDVTVTPPRILRTGPIGEAEIREALEAGG